MAQDDWAYKLFNSSIITGKSRIKTLSVEDWAKDNIFYLPSEDQKAWFRKGSWVVLGHDVNKKEEPVEEVFDVVD